MTDGSLGVVLATSKNGKAYIKGLYGPDGVAQKLRAMGLESHKFMKWQKQAAIIVAQRATHLAPKITGNLALHINGYAGKKITPNNQPARQLYGGVVIAQPRVKGGATYGKAVSFGRFYKANFERGAIRTPGNKYMKNAREQTRSAVVKMWNKEIKNWIESEGFETTGLGG